MPLHAKMCPKEEQIFPSFSLKPRDDNDKNDDKNDDKNNNARSIRAHPGQKRRSSSKNGVQERSVFRALSFEEFCAENFFFTKKTSLFSKKKE